MNLEEAKVLAEEFLDTYNLNHGNAEIIEQDGDLYASIEARRNTTLGFWMNKNEIDECEGRDEFIEYLKYRCKIVVNEFDVDEKFNELWDVEFGKHNGFTAREFMELLDRDFEFFEDVAGRF